jgi:hypothetical protein
VARTLMGRLSTSPKASEEWLVRHRRPATGCRVHRYPPCSPLCQKSSPMMFLLKHFGGGHPAPKAPERRCFYGAPVDRVRPVAKPMAAGWADKPRLVKKNHSQRRPNLPYPWVVCTCRGFGFPVACSLFFFSSQSCTFLSLVSAYMCNVTPNRKGLLLSF